MYNSLRLLLIILLGANVSSIAQTFSTPGPYSYTVPAGVTGITVTIKGAPGGLNSDEADYSDRRGYGGCVTAVITVTPGQVLQGFVGGRGGDGTASAGGAGGYNGGGAGEHGLSIFSGGGGGGSSDIRMSPYNVGDRLVVAGGGGGAGVNCGGDDDRGGDGGPAIGEDGGGCFPTTGGGGGGTASGGIGGVCPTCSFPGTLPGLPGSGPTGGVGGPVSAGGGGGGGYFGGGGGQYSGGGGGSDYAGGPGVFLVSDTRGCNTSGIANGSVTIAVSCTAGSIAGPTGVCVGSSITITDAVPGGTWVSGNPAIATIGATTGIVTGVSAGVVIMSYELASGVPGCRAVRTITVNPLPAPISSPALYVCQFSSITMADDTLGGIWSSTNPGLATITPGGIVTGVGPGLDTIRYTMPVTGCSVIFPLLVNPVPPNITGPNNVCVGSCINLSDATSGGTWSIVSGTGTATISLVGQVCGISAGTVTVSYTVGVCAATYSVTVNPLPAALTGPSPMRACMGSTITIASATTGGAWSVSTPAVGTIDAVSGVFTPIAVGTDTVFYIMPTGCSRFVVVTVNPLPAAIAGPSVVCEGSTITLTDASGAGTWSTVVVGLGTIGSTTGVYGGIGVAGGVDTVIFRLTSTGCTVSKTVTVNPRPTIITGPNPVCQGTIDTLLSGPAGGTWTSVTTTVGTIGSIDGIFTAIAPGTTIVRYTLSTGCLRSYTMTVNITPVPIAGPRSVCKFSSVTLTDATSGGTWSGTDAFITVTGAGTSASVFGESAGVSIVTYGMATGCKDTFEITVYDLPGPITGPSDVCQGDSILLSDTSAGGTWSSSLTAVADVHVPSAGWIFGVGGGVATITYTMATGCYMTTTVNVTALPSAITGPTTICNGAPPYTILSGGGAGTWSSSNTGVATINSITGDVNIVGAGVTDFCYTFSTGLACYRCKTLTVNPNPGVITGPNTVCTGATITVADTPSGGTFTAANGNATVGAITGVVTGVTPGVDTIYYTNAGGCVSAGKVITVNASPAAITGTLSICLGQSTVLTSGPGGGSWSATTITGSANIAPVFSTTTTATSTGAGTVQIRYTMASGCFSQAILTINTLSTPIVGPSQVCTGATITLTEAVGGTWSSSVPAVGTIGSVTGIVGGISPGTTVITFTSGGCQITKTVTVYQTPTAIITPLSTTNLCPGDVVALTATTGAGYTYVWRLGAGVIPGATNATYITGTPGSYTVTISTGFCQATSTPVNVTLNPVTATIAPSGVINTCASTPPNLNAGPGGMSYQWMMGGVPISGAVAAIYSATASGTYSVKVTNGFGCSSTSPTVTVNLTSSPVAVITALGATTFCSGGSVTLSTPTGTGYSYQWKLGGLPIAGATNSTFNATVGGSYTVTVTNTLSCATTSTAVVITLVPAPPAFITPSTPTIVCAGGAAILVAPSGSYYYQWYKGGVAIPGATNVSYSATTSGSYTVKVTGTVSGCSTTSSAQTVTVVPMPTVSPLSATSFCWGSSVTLTANVLGGIGTVNYQWARNGVNIPGATGASYVATTAGLYTVTVTLVSSLCVMTPAGTYITVYPLPSPIVTFDGTYFHTGPFVSYQWYKNLVAIPGATGSTVINSGIGSYSVRVTDIHGCQSVSPAYYLAKSGGSTDIRTSKPGTEENPGTAISYIDGVRIYPNPAQNIVHIESDEPLHAFVSSIDGRVLIDKADVTDIDVSHLANGVYIIKLYNAQGEMVKSEKLVKSAN